MKKKNPLQKILSGTRKSFSEFQDKMVSLKKRHDHKFEHGVPQPMPKSSHEDVRKIALEVSPGTVAKSTTVVLLLLLLFYFLYLINGILVLFFVSFLFAAALDPIVDFMQKRRFPRGLSILLIYILIFYILGVSLSTIIPIIAKQITGIGVTVAQFVQNLTASPDQASPFTKQFKPIFDQLYQAIDIKTAATQAQSALQAVGILLQNISFGLMNMVLVLVLTFFMTVEERALHDFFLSLFPSRYGSYISTRIEAVKEKIGNWLRGQLLLSFVAGALTYIGLLVLGVEYALTLSVIAGILMVIPVMGRIFSWLLILPIVLNQSPVLAFWASVYYFILFQVENNFLVPYIMNRAVGLSPIIIIFAMLVGSQFLPILGLVISIPIATCVAIFVKDYTEKAK